MNKKKQKLILDLDLTTLNSIKAIVNLYDIDFRYYKNYKKINWTDISSYDFKELSLINKNIILDYFDDFRFFQIVEFMDTAFEVINKLSEKYHIIFCSRGRRQNLYYKREFIEKYFPFAEFIGIDLSLPNKSMIDMSGAIIVDDETENLDSCNADTKIVFGEEYHWSVNKNCYPRCYNWTELEKLLMI